MFLIALLSNCWLVLGLACDVVGKAAIIYHWSGLQAIFVSWIVLLK